jgi:hypothetical protein
MLGGWYYDVPPATGPPLAHPRLPGLLRPFKSAPDAKVSLVFGCETQVIK